MAHVKVRRLGGANTTLSVAGTEIAAEAHIKFDDNGEAVITADEWEALAPAADKLGVYAVDDNAKGPTTLHKLQKAKNPKRFK